MSLALRPRPQTRHLGEACAIIGLLSDRKAVSRAAYLLKFAGPHGWTYRDIMRQRIARARERIAIIREHRNGRPFSE
jgi:hypothetical protein